MARAYAVMRHAERQLFQFPCKRARGYVERDIIKWITEAGIECRRKRANNNDTAI